MKFIKEKAVTQALEKYNFSEDIKTNIQHIYDCYAMKFECEHLKSKVEDLLLSIFKNPTSSEVYIPFNFLKSTLGIFLMSVYMEAEREYSPNDVAEIAGYTRQKIYNDIEEGIIVADKTSGGKGFNITDTELKKYLKLKGKL